MNRCPLRKRELETVRWLSFGKTAQETAELMKISIHTVNHNIMSALNRTGANKATGLVGRALREGWID